MPSSWFIAELSRIRHGIRVPDDTYLSQCWFTLYHQRNRPCKTKISQRLQEQHGDIQDVQQVAKGSYGNVYRGTLRKGMPYEKDVAVKVNKKSQTAHNDLENEVAIMKTLQHGNIIDCCSWQSIDHRPNYVPRSILVMEYCKKGTLYDVLRDARETKKKLVESDLLRWMLEFGSAVQYMHEKHVIHRDLKPSNLLMANRDGRIVLMVADLGESKQFTPGQKLMSFVGTVIYMARKWTSVVFGTRIWSVDFAAAVSLLSVFFHRSGSCPTIFCHRNGPGRRVSTESRRCFRTPSIGNRNTHNTNHFLPAVTMQRPTSTVLALLPVK